MYKRWVKLGVFLLAAAVFASSGWAQQERQGQPGARAGQRGFGFMRSGDLGESISVVLLLDEAISAKVKEVCDKESQTLMEAMRAMRQSGGGDREAMRAKMQEEREKSAQRIKDGLKGILSEAQINDVGPILTGSSMRRDAYLWALASLKLSPDQRARMVGVTVRYAKEMQAPSGRPAGGQPADRTARQERMREQGEAFRKAAGDILTAAQKQQWEDEAAKIQKRWEEERQQRGQRGGGQRQRQ